MTLYHVTTEGDCEGRTTKDLGYVEADSPEHAIKYLHSIGKYAYYEYYIHQVEENPIQVATPMVDWNILKQKLKLAAHLDLRGSTMKIRDNIADYIVTCEDGTDVLLPQPIVWEDGEMYRIATEHCKGIDIKAICAMLVEDQDSDLSCNIPRCV